MGRKTKFNDALVEIVCIAHENGAPMNLCAKYAGIDRKTLYNWIKKGKDAKKGKFKEFYLRWEKSDAKYQLKHLQNINEHSKSDWKASKYLLEVNNPDEFVIERKVKQEIEQNGELTLNQNISNETEEEKLEKAKAYFKEIGTQMKEEQSNK